MNHKDVDVRCELEQELRGEGCTTLLWVASQFVSMVMKCGSPIHL